MNSHAHHLDSHISLTLYSQCSEVMCFDMVFVSLVFLVVVVLSFYVFKIQCTHYLFGPFNLKICISYLLVLELNFFDSFVSSIFCVFFFRSLLLDGCWTSCIFSSFLSCFSSLFVHQTAIRHHLYLSILP